MRCVIDSNLFISHLLVPTSTPAQAVRHVFRHHTVLMSEMLLLELGLALSREKFDAYVSHEERRQFLHKLHRICEPVAIIQRIRACRDENDDLILELAVNGMADCIVSGDKDLLALHPFRGISICTAAHYLQTTAKH